MKKLLETWKKHVLTEAMKMPQDLPENIKVVIDLKAEPELIKFYYYNAEERKMSSDPSGVVWIKKPTEKEGNCYNAYIIVMTAADSGWGILLYELAIEFATARGRGLIPDRVEVSDEAYRVWQIYFNNREDVDKFQLDNLKNELTFQERDNCKMYSAGEKAKKYGHKWFQDPLAKVYKKKNANTLNSLKNLNKLIILK